MAKLEIYNYFKSMGEENKNRVFKLKKKMKQKIVFLKK